MGCKKCGEGLSYNKFSPYKKCECQTIDTSCGCKIELGSECVRWDDENITYLNVKTNERLTSIIKKLSEKINELEYGLKYTPKLDVFKELEVTQIRTSSPFDVGTLKVFKNGILLNDTDYTTLENEKITFTSQLITTDVVRVDYFKIEGYELE